MSNYTCSIIAVIIISSVASIAQAESTTWTLTPFTTRSVDPELVQTFEELLQIELSNRGKISFVRSNTPCSDSPCAQREGEARGTSVALYGSVNSLGVKIIVTATAIDVNSGALKASSKMTADRVEDLEAVAARIAASLLSGKSSEETAELGTITEKETQPDLRREGDHGVGLRVGGLVPLGNGYSKAGFGVLFDLAYVYEARHFAIHPRIGVRLATERAGDANYFQLPIDMAASYIIGVTDVALMLGGGAGIRYHWEDHRETIPISGVISMTHEAKVDDGAWGFGFFTRIGGLFFRTYSVRMTVTVEFDMTFVTLHGYSYPRALTFGVGVIL